MCINFIFLHVLLLHEVFSSKRENSIGRLSESFKLESVQWESQYFSKATLLQTAFQQESMVFIVNRHFLIVLVCIEC